MSHQLCVAGAGTMGSGIALCAAQHNIPTVLFDISEGMIDKAIVQAHAGLDMLITKEKISAAQKSDILANIHFTSSIEDCLAPVIIEAIVEKLEVKETLFNQLARLNSDDAILASNTSSLSITAIQEHLPHPGRVAGLHFFNPAQIMKLTEIVKGRYTTDDTIDKLKALCTLMKKTFVVCTDSPGFIVNRVARPYYLEAMRLVEQGNGLEAVDAALEAAGFRMGPFRLMDLIGMDINLAVSTSLYEAFNHEARFQPSPLQIEKVAAQQLGRKTGRGFYDYN